MNVFILNTGRCGSMSFIKACKNITNYSCAHESLSTFTGAQRFAYPLQHIEADNRLSWFLGKLDKLYGDNAFYVHLQRDKQKTIDSFSKRENFGIMQAYKQGVLLGGADQSTEQIAEDYIETVKSNIDLFLKDKTNKISFFLEKAEEDFKKFWNIINAEGDLQAALKEWDFYYNAS